MKNKILLIGATVFLSLSSCNNTDSHLYTGRFVIHADREAIQPTKTEIKDGTSIVWKQGDAISLFVDEGKRGGYKFVSKNAESSSSTEFEGDFKADGASHTYWAVYPYDESNLCDGNSVTVMLPSAQVAKAGSFGDDLFISVARASTNHMEFFNVCGGIKFSVNCDDVREVVISNSDGKPMSGTMRIVMDAVGRPEVESIVGGSPDLRAIAPFGETFAKGTNYYAVIPPVTFSKGVTIKYITTEGKESSPIALPSSTIDRSVFSRLPAIETPTSFTYSPYLTFVSAGESSVSFNTDANLEYSYDGVTWENVSGGNAVGLTKYRPQILLRGINHNISNADNGPVVQMSGDKIACYGSVMKLLDYRENITAVPKECFKKLFEDCEQLTHAPELPATTLAESCYGMMFYGCTSLVTAPELPATTLAYACYGNMFSHTSLVSAPELPATALVEVCYSGMFSDCTSLVSAPELPATTLARSCYSAMFFGCTSLVSAPELPATTLAEYCYYGMFSDCTSLVTTHRLPAMTLAKKCYAEMFTGCTSLVSAPELPATVLAEYCYSNMFSDCTSLVMVPGLPASVLAGECCERMFSGCTSLMSAPTLPSTTLASGCYYGMFSDCTSLVSAPELPATTLAGYCYDSMFSGCTSLVAAPELPATTLAVYCYDNMFSGCTSLVTAPGLPATTLAKSCYRGMFYGCASLVTAPELPATALTADCYLNMFSRCTSLMTAPGLPATTLAESCYGGMFYGCTSLVSAPELPAIELADGCYGNMLGRTSLVSAPELPATILAQRCYYGMFSDCTSLVSAPKLPATELTESCYCYMFSGCSNLKSVTALFEKSVTGSLNGWLTGVSSIGTFYKNAEAVWENSGIIPDGWDVVLVKR